RVADPVVEADPPLGGVRLEIRCGIANFQRHLSPPWYSETPRSLRCLPDGCGAVRPPASFRSRCAAPSVASALGVVALPTRKTPRLRRADRHVRRWSAEPEGLRSARPALPDRQSRHGRRRFARLLRCG